MVISKERDGVCGDGYGVGFIVYVVVDVEDLGTGGYMGIEGRVRSCCLYGGLGGWDAADCGRSWSLW